MKQITEIYTIDDFLVLIKILNEYNFNPYTKEIVIFMMSNKDIINEKLSLMDDTFKSLYCLDIEDIFTFSIINDLFDVFQHFHNLELKWEEQHILLCIEYNRMSFLHFMFLNGLQPDKKYSQKAYEIKQIDCLLFLTDMKCDSDLNVLTMIMTDDNLETLIYILSKRYFLNDTLLNLAYKFKAINCLDYLIKNNFEYNSELITIYTKYTSIECVKLMLSSKMRFNVNTLNKILLDPTNITADNIDNFIAICFKIF